MKARTFATIGIFSAIAVILSYFDFMTPFFPAFLKLDFADLPALLIAFTVGPKAGVLIQLIRNIIHLLITSTGGIGELSNFLIGGTFVAVAGCIYNKNHTKKGAILSLLGASILMTIVAVIANYFILLPFYAAFIPMDKIIAMASAIIPQVHDMFTFLLFVTVPFNILKATLISILAFLLYKRLHPVINAIRNKA